MRWWNEAMKTYLNLLSHKPAEPQEYVTASNKVKSFTAGLFPPLLC